MIDLNALIQQAFGVIEDTIPQALVYGRLVKYDKTYNRTTSVYEFVESDSQDVKGVFDYEEEMYRVSENSNSVISKIHLFGLLSKPVGMFDELQLNIDSEIVKYKTEELRKINVGESSVLHTFMISN